jgi:hypothetical protein
MAILWRIAGNPNLKATHIEMIEQFVSKNLARCSDENFNYDLASMLGGGAYVDAPLIDNPSLSLELKTRFELLVSEIEKAKK